MADTTTGSHVFQAAGNDGLCGVCGFGQGYFMHTAVVDYLAAAPPGSLGIDFGPGIRQFTMPVTPEGAETPGSLNVRCGSCGSDVLMIGDRPDLRQRFLHDPLFHQVVQYLVRASSPEEVVGILDRLGGATTAAGDERA